MRTLPGLLGLFCLFPLALHADGPKDNIPENVRRIPPPGIKVPDDVRNRLESGLKEFDQKIATLTAKGDGKLLAAYLPDVLIYHKAVHDALKYDEFFDAKEFPVAGNLLKTGMKRADDLLKGEAPWTKETGLVVRGYRSRIDDTVQPYGLVIPKNHDPKKKIRLDFWCHGRSEKLSELSFINTCQTSPGQFATDKAIVANLYGRYCNANKFAGEIDCFEVLEHVKQNYLIDEDRLVIRGFSMGGAACWQFAVHYPDRWVAAAPGAGFSETPDFLKVFQKEEVKPTIYEQKLWRMYNATDYALNLYNLPTIAYSGEIDKQKQAADMMEKAMKAEGLKLVHIIGPKTGHSYEKGAKAEIIKQIDAIADKGRPALPAKIKFITYTLRYNSCFWLTVTGMEEHWEAARCEAEMGPGGIEIKTKGVTGLTLTLPEKTPLPAMTKVTIDGNSLPLSVKGQTVVHLHKSGTGWHLGKDTSSGLRKVPGLQGPIDDAFLNRFIMVRPTQKSSNEAVGKWVDAELKHAVTHWRQQFRGNAIVKDDKEITEQDIANSNLVLWGDPSSNHLIRKIVDQLPVSWKDGKIVTGKTSFDASTHVPILIYPNPLNPKKYVVLNSGFTYREYDYLNNARQVPKLPDWAVVDVTSPVTARAPGKIVAADFFDESWQLKKAK